MKIARAFIKLLKDENSELAKKRLAICKDCEDRCGAICCNCGCYLKAKVRDEKEECPLKKW